MGYDLGLNECGLLLLLDHWVDLLLDHWVDT